MKVAGQLYVADDITGNKNLNIEKNASINKNLTVEKKIIAPNLPAAEVLGNKDILIKGNNGVLKTTKLGALVDAVYKVECHQLNDGTYPNPIWNNKPGVIYAGAPCPPGTKVAVGTQDAIATLDIRGNVNLSEHSTTSIPNDVHVQVATSKDKALVVSNTTNDTDVFRVYSNGTVWATEINVDQKEDFPDYVFASDYELMPISELETFIAKENHLPNIPSAEEVKKNGQNVANLQLKQMEKIEELTLYMIQMNNKLESIQKENNQLKKEIELLKLK